MPRYNVSLTHSFVFEVEAESPEMAELAVDSFVGYADDSTPTDHANFRFEIQHIEMTVNEVLEIQLTSEQSLF